MGNSLTLLDPQTLQSVEVQAERYWRSPWESLASTREVVEFMVLDIEPWRGGGGGGGEKRNGRWVGADAQVALASAFRSSSSGAHGAQDAMDFSYDYDADN